MAIWNILQTLGIFYDHLIHFVFILYIFPVIFWVIFTKKNLATLPKISFLLWSGFFKTFVQPEKKQKNFPQNVNAKFLPIICIPRKKVSKNRPSERSAGLVNFLVHF
jgi:hypothetical protein